MTGVPGEFLAEFVGEPVTHAELKHKPGRRRTSRVSGPRGSAILKVYASDRAPTVAARVAQLAAGPPQPTTPKVLHVDAARHFVVLSEVPGRPFSESLLAGNLATCGHAGAALGAWHGAWHRSPMGVLRPHPVERELELLERASSHCPEAMSNTVMETAEGLAQPWTAVTVVHRDLYEEQLLVDSRTGIGMIDLDDAAFGPPELDVGNLLAHIQLLSLRLRRDLSAPLRALLGGYAAQGPTLGRALMDRCRRLTLLRLACIHRKPELVRLARQEPAGP